MSEKNSMPLVLNEFLKEHPQKIIFISGIIFFLFIAFFVNTNFISPDGRSYQRMAVNISKGNGFSAKIEAPYEKQFFREPGYPFFFSFACLINNFIGNENSYLPFADTTPGYYENSHFEIFILRILQALLASLTILFFFKILSFFLKPEIAFCTSILFIFYLPFAIFVSFPQREILVTFLLTCMGYLFIKSASEEKAFWYDALFGLFSAFLILSLQAYVFILPIFLLAHFIISGKIKKTLLSAFVILCVFVFVISPWIYRAYKESGNIRVAKSFGVSYTYEFKKYHDTLAKAYRVKLNGMSDEYIKTIIDSYSEPGTIMFEKSFNGYYLRMADSLNHEIKNKEHSDNSGSLKFTLKNLITRNFRKALIWPLWKPDYRTNISTTLNNQRIAMLISFSLGIIFALFALVGILIFIRKTWYFIPVFVFHFIMIPMMADEGRRVLPFLPFYFMFLILGVLFILKRYKIINSGNVRIDSDFLQPLVKGN